MLQYLSTRKDTVDFDVATSFCVNVAKWSGQWEATIHTFARECRVSRYVVHNMYIFMYACLPAHV